jgi:replicative DNA helicase
VTAAHVPRHDLDAEAAVLSACLLDPTGAALDQARTIVSSESWYRPAHRLVWDAACWLADRSEPVDVVTVAGRLKTIDRAAEVGGVPWLSALCDAAPHVANVEAYARTVRDTWTQREVVATLQRAIAEGYGDVGDVREWASSVEGSIAKLSVASARRTSDFVGDVVRDVFERVRDGKAGLRVRTGLRSLDERLSSQVGDLVIIAARPGMGKTALVGGIAVAVGLSESDTEHAAALMLSAEMDRAQIAQRLLSAEAKVPLSALRHANVGDYGWASLTQSAQRLDACALVLDDKPAPTLAHVRSVIRETKRNLAKWETPTGKPRALRLVIVDYLQIMGVDREKGKNREQEISELSRGLKQIAREEEVVVFALSQLNRGVEARANKRPLLSDLRESGAIEQDADAIVFVYRDEYYNPKGAKGVAECLVAKNRNDATGRAFVKFEGVFTLFSDLSVSEEEQLRRESKED